MTHFITLAAIFICLSKDYNKTIFFYLVDFCFPVLGQVIFK